MRINCTLETLFPAIRAGILGATLLEPDRWWFMSELARHLEVTPSSLQRELDSLVRAGILLRRDDGRRAYIQANAESPLFPELRGLLAKTAGLVPQLKSALQGFGDRIELALLYGSVARGEEHSGSDVDLLIVGAVAQIDLLRELRKLEARLMREVHVTLFSAAEFERRREEHFLRSVLGGRHIVLKGAAHELEQAAQGT